MRYKHDTLLPIGAFKRQGSVVGGRSMRLHGGDSWWSQPEETPQDGYYQNNGDSDGWWVSTPAADPITQPAAAPLTPAAQPTPAPAAPPVAASEPSQPASPYRIEGYTTGAAGDAGTNTVYSLVDPDGNGVFGVRASTDDYGGISGYYIDNSSGGGESDSMGSQTYIDLDAINARAEKGNVPFGTGMGPALGYEYGMKNSSGDIFRKFDAKGNLTEYLDDDLKWQKASDFKPVGLQFNSMTGNLETKYTSPNSKRANITESNAMSVNRYHHDQGGWLGEGGWSRMAGLVAAGLSAGVAGGAFAGAGLGSAFGSGVAAINPILTSAVQGALIGTATSGLQGAAPADMLKSAVIGGISAGGGSAISGAGFGTVGNIAARTGLQTGLTAISGGDVGKAAISGIINGVLQVALTEILPADTMSAFNSLPDSVKKVVMSTAGSVLNAGFNGQDLSDAATNGVVNGMISLGKDFAKGAFNNLSESDLAQTIKGYFNPSSTAGDFTGSYDDISSYDPNVALDDVINNLSVTTPPLIQNSMGQVDPNDVYRELVAGYENPYSASSLGTLASATTSDVNPVTLPTITVTADPNEEEAATEGRFSVDDQALNLFNEIMQEEGRPDLIAESLSDPRLQDFVNRANERIGSSSGIPSGLYSLGTGEVRPVSGATVGDSPLQSPLDIQSVVADMLQRAEFSDVSALLDVSKNPVIADALYSEGMRKGATPEQAQALVDAFLSDPNSVNAIRQEVMRILPVDTVESAQPVPPPLVQDAINRTVEQEQVDPEKVKPAETPKVNAPRGGSGTQGGSLAGDQGRVGAAAPLASQANDSNVDAAAALATLPQQEFIANESESVVSELASLGAIDPADIPIVAARLTQNSKLLNVTPTVAVTTGLVQSDGTLSDRGVTKVASETGLSKQEIENAVRGSSTIEAGTGSGLKGDGTGGSKGDGTGVAGNDGLGGNSGSGVGGQGSGVGTGVGSGSGSGSGSGGLPSGSFGGARLTINPQFPGALPGNLEGTYLKGVDVDAYDPFENYNTYQQIAPVNAAQGGSPLQLMQLQQGIVGGDPRQYSMVQPRPAPNYFTYGADTSSNTPTTFAGSQLMGKPKPSIPVTPTGNIGANDWMYGSAGSNQLSPAGAGIPALPSGLMAEGGMAHGGLDEGEHIPEFITGKTGNYVKGRGTGQSDEIPAMLADGEWVADADVVAALGDGSSDAGAELLDAFRHVIRDHKRSAPSDKIPPAASPLAYMKEALQRTGRLK